MKETKASVTRFNSTHLSKLTTNTDVSLGQLHKLTSTKVPKKILDDRIDFELLREIENSVLNKYKQTDSASLQRDEDDGPIVFMSEHFYNLQPFQDQYNMKLIRESYDKFRRETVRDQKMKDLLYAINEGVNQNINPDATDKENNEDLFSMSDGLNSSVKDSKGAHQMFREYLSEFKQLNYDSLDIENIEHIQELK